MSRGAPGRTAQALMLLCLLFTLAALAYTLHLEFGPWRDFALQTDEQHFGACAARSLATGQWPSTGCHDNKGPLIYTLHESLLWLAGGYSTVAVKAAAYGVLLALAGLAATIATRAGGPMAGLTTAPLLLQALLPASSLQALKTETVGMLFVLAAAALLLIRPPPRGPGPLQLLLAGALLGAALLTKQTYALLLPMLPLWLVLCRPDASWRKRLAEALRALALSAGAATALFAAVLAWFHAQGRAKEFMAAYLLYPSVYASGPPRTPRDLLERFSEFLRLGVQGHELLVVAALAVTALLLAQRRRATRAPLDVQDSARWLLLLLALPITLALFAAPTLWEYHPIPFWLVLAPLAGCAFGDAWRRWPSGPLAVALTPLAALLAGAGLMTLSAVWGQNAGHGRSAPAPRPPLEGAAGRYGYFLGMPDPDFYTSNGLTPASDVMYPWALPGYPGFWLYTPPPEGSGRALLLRAQQAANLQRLFVDFAHTPPAYIAILQEPDHPAPEGQVSHVPGFDDYLREHCRRQSEHRAGPDGKGKPVLLYRCN